MPSGDLCSPATTGGTNAYLEAFSNLICEMSVLLIYLIATRFIISISIVSLPRKHKPVNRHTDSTFPSRYLLICDRWPSFLMNFNDFLGVHYYRMSFSSASRVHSGVEPSGIAKHGIEVLHKVFRTLPCVARVCVVNKPKASLLSLPTCVWLHHPPYTKCDLVLHCGSIAY